MTQVEEGRLSWANDTQWALNKIGMSQVAVFNSQSVTNQQKVRICCYFNEGSYVHDFNHGNYKHICSHCYKQGHSLPHPEMKCNLKTTNRPPAIRGRTLVDHLEPHHVVHQTITFIMNFISLLCPSIFFVINITLKPVIIM